VCATLAIAAAAALLLAVPLAGGAAEPSKTSQTYKWVDERGVTHYGDRIPPEYARSERAVLNHEGVEIKRLEAQKSPEQQREEQRLAEEKQRLRDHDVFLLTTYASPRDIEQLRDQRLALMSDQRKSTQAYVDALESRLADLQLKAQFFRPYSSNAGARRMPDQMAEDLVRTLNEVGRQRAALNARLEDENQLRSQFQADLERYKALKTPGIAQSR
jgi:hypothetical protein